MAQAPARSPKTSMFSTPSTAPAALSATTPVRAVGKAFCRALSRCSSLLTTSSMRLNSVGNRSRRVSSVIAHHLQNGYGAKGARLSSLTAHRHPHGWGGEGQRS